MGRLFSIIWRKKDIIETEFKKLERFFCCIFHEDNGLKLLEGVKTFNIDFIIGKWGPIFRKLKERIVGVRVWLLLKSLYSFKCSDLQ